MGKKLNYALAILLLIVGINYLFGFVDFLLSPVAVAALAFFIIGIGTVFIGGEDLGPIIGIVFILLGIIFAVALFSGDTNLYNIGPPGSTGEWGSIDLLGASINIAGFAFIILGIVLVIYTIKKKYRESSLSY